MDKKITIVLPSLEVGGAEKNFVKLANYWKKNNIPTRFHFRSIRDDFGTW